MASNPTHSTANHLAVDVQHLPSNDNPALNRHRDRQSNMINGREGKATTKLTRQISLETGITVLGAEKNKQANSKTQGEGPRSLARSGRSLGYLAGAAAAAAEVAGQRRGDFNLFRTKSTLGSRQNSLPLHRKEYKATDLNHHSQGVHLSAAADDIPVGRYFAALRGPELDEVKDSEDILLPKDELWPFLLRFPIGCFGICLGLGSQAVLWRALATSPATEFLRVSADVNLALWLLAVTVLVSFSITYVLKCAFYCEAVRREYFHPVRVNFFFAPWIASMFLAIAVPPRLAPKQLHPAVWCTIIAPVFALELKIYGQWLSGGKRRLSKVANPSSHLSVVGNFVGAILAAKVGWEEAGRFLWAVGLAHYICVFVTLYQRLPTSETLPKELHPVYSMFIATPSAASIAWGAVYGRFDAVARSFLFIALFLYCSLVVRINFFRGFKFSVAWWSYTFPMTTASVASIKYAEEVPCFFSKGLAVSLSLMSSTMVLLLLVWTLLNAFIWRSLFPNDLAIAITRERVIGTRPHGKEKKAAKKRYDLRRWAMQSSLSLVSSIRKGKPSQNKESEFAEK